MRTLRQDERDELLERYLAGDESMICTFPVQLTDGETYVCAFPMGELSNDPSGSEIVHPAGAVWLPELDTDRDRCLTAAEARKYAIALLEAADHAEYGPRE